ncbi:Cytochrome c oxidase assembly protein cox11, mitochondrial [Coemansia sp. RSA 989]|nr:cytochrome oxidase assembly factor COX11 [Coemansia mojavensis]KAJ1740162.1 Cytochrome c oxidase assembly protein cox11, mitochondrial [Coemansia sp. RSA 1086]KAJ1748570.1 Cytochrome c oxidase assembly protein cox11, mitochondrial [Coemansia sp. RSA 1821]KAJ1865755.1 Cytochrome c oxidase assembly protein cox11, mitochondrial [Coemansia sp. RSA 989]KAJ1873676.1 Cytochrome c oxidase assembly protein cox11, mitochondrial [Coemansia sp. RSA 990]KAJ2671417.1 Cytochrome c oxidase assembly protein
MLGIRAARIPQHSMLKPHLLSRKRPALVRGTANKPQPRLTAQAELRQFHEQARRKNLTGILYVGSFVITFLGIAYAAVPLYRLLCKRTGFMGTPKTEPVIRDKETLKPLEGHRKLRIKFSGQVSTMLDWSFKPEQRQVMVVPGETALAFFKAFNHSDKPIIGIATYNVIPEQAAPYFNKIQCFCFDEQQLDPQEDIDMPVFFFIDPEFANDPLMDDIDDITLSYTFFKASGR